MRDEESRRKRTRCLACIAFGVIAQTIIIVLFVVIVMRVKTPKVRLESVGVTTLTTRNSSFKADLDALVTVKNKNFGHYKFDSAKATFSYKGTDIGEGTISKDKAKANKTKKINVTLSLNSNKITASDISSGNVTLTAYAKLDGKVHLLNIIKKKKSSELNCTIHVDTKAKAVHVLSCK
ncbi:late embryogenesis abundant protein At1g64065-like [Argentina anserina]|uniref:late embryogenesis abundant protein At1g64065-like n=1 Tax=Argentina anserina TaxID=57926 RepID=UPI00217695AC|nr:late embryogenesis abundant protein At1g64065-like [Potentilla anserina]